MLVAVNLRHNALRTQYPKLGTSALPLEQRYLYLRLLPRRGPESDLQVVVSSYN
jgi:hypothetical protein